RDQGGDEGLRRAAAHDGNQVPGVGVGTRVCPVRVFRRHAEPAGRFSMGAGEEVSLWHALYRVEVRYWHEGDSKGGRRAHEFYAPDGVMCVGHNRFEGRDRIREFYAWRERQALTAISSVKTTRILINNLFVESSDGSRAKVLGIVSFYGPAVRPPAPQTKPPMLIA